LENVTEKDKESGVNLLKALELCDEEMFNEGETDEEQMVLSEEMVTSLKAIRDVEMNVGLHPCEKMRKNNKESWGPILVDRQRRKQNDWTTMLQKAMLLKQKKNLEPLKGNSFASLHSESLYQFVKDVNVHLGVDSSEAQSIISKLVGNEIENVNKFVEENLEVLLPANMEIDLISEKTTEQALENSNQLRDQALPEPLEGSPQPLKWTEVVKRGRPKSRSKLDSNSFNEGRILKY
jgi:hypothetical protein